MILTESFNVLDSFLDISNGLSSETISSLIVIGIICLLSFYIAIRARFADPLKKPKGILLIAEIGVNFFDGLVENMMGKRYRGFGGFIMAIAVYLFIAFIFGLTGLPSPVANLATTLSLGLITFVLIHANAVRYQKWKYFKRYIDPVPFFLPVNLISMWAPLLSLTLRLFGNAVAGWTLMTLIYGALNGLGNTLITFVVNGAEQYFRVGGLIAPIATPILHAYFDLFSGLIQTTVFIFLSMIFISNEGPEDDAEIEISKEGGTM